MIFLGYTKCPLCGEVIMEGDVYTLFPYLISNMKDPLFPIGDTGVHMNCLRESSIEEKAFHYREEYHKYRPSPSSRCIVDGLLITDPSDIIFFGLLTSNSMEELHEYNFLVINRKNLKIWKKKWRFLIVAESYLEEGKWESYNQSFNFLADLFDRIKNG